MGEIPAPDYGNIHGLPRATCVGCGECDLGCNFGAKNTLDHTYLSAAQHAGADIRVRHEVKGFRPLGSDEGGGYEVTYVVHTGQDGEPRSACPVQTIPCDRLVLSAGTFGVIVPAAPQPRGLARPERRARHPVLRQRRPARVRAAGQRARPAAELDANTGPVITSAIRVADDV